MRTTIMTVDDSASIRQHEHPLAVARKLLR